MAPARTLIVDDSIIVRQVLRRELTKDPDIEIVGSAPDPYIARDKILELKPDVITLDLEMPRMDGITFLRKLMKSYPLPVIVVSALTAKGCALTLEALEMGAIDVVEKPSFSDEESLAEFSVQLCDKIKAAAKARVSPAASRSQRRGVRPALRASRSTEGRLIAIGASTGGTDALRVVLSGMPKDCPPIVVVQHMPENFTEAFARRLNDACEIEVVESQSNMDACPGRAIIANGGHHLVVSRSGLSRYRVENRGGPLVCRHRPSVEVLFNSVAKAAGDKAIGVMLTGMGADGSQAMLNMRNAGARTIAQDEESCVVFGMPKEAIKINAVEKIVSLDKIPQSVFSFL